MTFKRLGDILLDFDKVNERDIEHAMALQKDAPTNRIGRLLIDLGYILEKDCVEALANQWNIPVFDESVHLPKVPDFPQIEGLNDDWWRDHDILPLEWNDETNTFHFIITDPTNIKILNVLKRRLSCSLNPYLSSPSEFETLFDKLFGRPEGLR